ncbi:prolyl aminopeptidase [Aquibaculum sediminis]|uniref:prolyl aminopeptidase n=1 Tax=Aquibaculum sediminis TaxID=3231907 RepID=UPI003453E198
MPPYDLFPPIEPYETGRLRVDDLHELYWEQSGNPDDKPVLFLHGGPGAGASADHRRFFDPAHYRIVIFDQRGAGRSTPLGELHENTTDHLIADIERLRDLLGIARWQVFGGSWGSTLALAYAQRHPERVAALVLRGIFMSRVREIEWFLYGLRNFFPEAWERFAGHLPEAERGDLLGNYLKRLSDPDPEVHRPAAQAWSTYEGACSTLLPSPDTVAAFGRERTAIGLARLEAHYFSHGSFLEEGALLRGVSRIRHIPAVIVQGRYDNVCPPITAWELAQAWPEAGFEMIADAGHSAMEPNIRRALVRAMERFKRL